mgnify:CR=1 FL=1
MVRPPVVSGAQEPLTQTVTAYGLSVRYPAGWVAVDAGNVMSVHPADRDVSNGQGPELVLFTLAGELDTQIAAYAGSISGDTGPVEIVWLPAAEKELKKIPFFVRGKARRNTENYALERGIERITLDTLYDAKAHYSH